ncbi:MAG: hypothetical protein ACI89J_004402, partial [Hyphomicrobiaceae bacterium]
KFHVRRGNPPYMKLIGDAVDKVRRDERKTRAELIRSRYIWLKVEHWTLENGGGGWDHPVHLHFEEGITISRDRFKVPATERLARKDVWRLGERGSVKLQIQFGEFGGAYVSHCHNTVHEDFAMLLRFDVLKDDDSIHAAIVPTPNPTPDGVTFLTPEILPEGDPRKS